jgi:Tfp pilus assembly protein PilW
MPVTPRDCIGDERGTTLVELVVGIAMSSAVMFAMTIVVITTMHASARDSAHVSATQLSRNGLSTIVQELHSACMAPRLAPLQVGSTGTSLSFVHATGSEVAPKPVLSVVRLSGDTLTQYDYPSTGGASPSWTFAATPSSTQALMTGVGPIPPQTSIFSYFSSANGQISSTPLATPLDAAGAAGAIEVSVGISTAPSANKRSADADASAQLQDSVLLRLTAPSYNETVSPPCE